MDVVYFVNHDRNELQQHQVDNNVQWSNPNIDHHNHNNKPLEQKSSIKIMIYHAKSIDVTNYGGIYAMMASFIDSIRKWIRIIKY